MLDEVRTHDARLLIASCSFDPHDQVPWPTVVTSVVSQLRYDRANLYFLGPSFTDYPGCTSLFRRLLHHNGL